MDDIVIKLEPNIEELAGTVSDDDNNSNTSVGIISSEKSDCSTNRTGGLLVNEANAIKNTNVNTSGDENTRGSSNKTDKSLKKKYGQNIETENSGKRVKLGDNVSVNSVVKSEPNDVSNFDGSTIDQRDIQLSDETSAGNDSSCERSNDSDSKSKHCEGDSGNKNISHDSESADDSESEEMYDISTKAGRRQKVIALLKKGYSASSAGRKCGVPRSTARRWAQRFKSGGEVKNRAGSGRPRISSKDEDDVLLEEAVSNPSLSASELKTAADFPGSLKTLRNRLKSWGIIIPQS